MWYAARIRGKAATGRSLFGLGGVARIHCGGRHPGGGAHLAARGGAKKSGTGGWGGEGSACLNLTQIRQCSPLCLVAEGTGRCSLNLSVSTFSGNDLTDSQGLLRAETRTLSHTPPQCQMQS